MSALSVTVPLLRVRKLGRSAVGRRWKVAVLLAILGAASLEVQLDHPRLGLLLQVPVAVALVVRAWWNGARRW